MRWLELSVEAGVEAVEAVSEILGRVSHGTAVHPTRLVRDTNDELVAREDTGAPFVVIAHIADGPSASAGVESTERALWHLQAFGLGPVGELRVRSVEDGEWTEAWRKHYVAQRIGRVVIVPSWADEPMRPGEVAVTLDPGMAFGTGLHPTTRGCLSLLQRLEPMPATVLDVGCGSGILSLAALRLGAEHADALDTDPLAVEATRANAERNGVAGHLSVTHGTLPERPATPYPLLLANLVAAVLVEMAPRLAAHVVPGGALIAGGIIAPRAAEVANALGGVGLEAMARREDGEWVTVLLERRAA